MTNLARDERWYKARSRALGLRIPVMNCSTSIVKARSHRCNPGLETTYVLEGQGTLKLDGTEDLQVGDWRRLDERIEGSSADITSLVEKDPACERLMTVPGIGPIISIAMVAAIGNGEVFSKGRDGRSRDCPKERHANLGEGARYRLDRLSRAARHFPLTIRRW